ncbi:hypothetical protein VTK26DRAFT_7450 [Humicola hyalothermophila]
MCLIGLLLPFKRRSKSRRHRSKSSSRHRRSERSRSERLSQRHDGDEVKALSLLSEDVLAQLYMTLEQGLVDDQARGRQDHERRGRHRRGDAEVQQEEEGMWRPSYRHEVTLQQQTTPMDPPPPFDQAVADGPDCAKRRASVDSACCCCCCSRGGRAAAPAAAAAAAARRYPTVPELDDNREKFIKTGPMAALYAESGVENRKQKLWPTSGPLSP